MISFQNVSMVYPNGTAALNNVTLNIKDGEFVFIIGKSGAGKTTLTKLLLCEERVTGGTLTVNNFKLNKLPQRKIPYLRRTLGVVFQDFRLFKNKTVYENIAFTLRVIGEDPRIIRKRVPYFLNVVDMTDKADRFPDELSGGEPEMSREIMDLLVRINKLGKTVIVVTHEKDLVDEYRHRVITIKDGEIVSDRSEGGYDEKD